MTLNGRKVGIGPGGAERDPRLDRVYHAAGGEVPPTHLDAAILAAAHREVSSRPRSLPATLRRWRVPVSIAAVVVLSVSLVTLIREEGGGDLMPVTPGVAPASRAREATPKPAQTDAEKLVAQPPTAASAPPRPAPQRDDAGDPVEKARRRAPAATARPAPRLEQDVVSAGAASSAGESFPPTATAPVEPPQRARVEARARKNEQSAAGRPDTATLLKAYESQPPEKWLEKIAELKRGGWTTEVAEMLTEFKRRFPGYPVPPGLQ